MSGGWDDFGDEAGEDAYAEDLDGDDSDELFLEDAVEEIYEQLDVDGGGDWLVSITLNDGTEWEMHVPIEMVWEIRDFAIEYDLDFDYEYEPA